MSRLFSYLRRGIALPTIEWSPTNLPCRFLEAWTFALPQIPLRSGVDPSVHDSDNALMRLISKASGAAAPFALCKAHRTEFARYELVNRAEVFARRPK
jgi:hypothetical protein